MPQNENKPSFAGGCQCGALRYRITEALGSTDICHCRMCQKAFGSFGAVLVRVNLVAFQWIRGEPGKFKSSAHVDRGFCRDCGTPMFMYEQGDTLIDLAAGTLDNPNAIKSLQSLIGIESRVNWWKNLSTLPEQTTDELVTVEDLRKYKSLQHPDHDTEVWPPPVIKK